jgi:hypothetical protein
MSTVYELMLRLERCEMNIYFSRKLESKSALWRITCAWKDNIKIYLKEGPDVSARVGFRDYLL